MKTIHLFAATALVLAWADACSSNGDPTSNSSNVTQGGAGDNKYDKPDPNRDSPCSLGQFGACLAEADCAPAKGHLSSVSCDAQGTVCCTPLDRCTGTEDFVCCQGGQEFRPTCDAHAGSPPDTPLGCPYGQTKGTHGNCPAG